MGASPPDDELNEFISRASKGDRRAYGRLFKECYEDIYDYIVRRVGNRSDAEDITMQVFASGLKAISSYEERGHSAKAWLYRIAHNAVVDHFRTAKQVVELDSVPEIPDGADIEEKISALEEVRGVYREITRLPTAQAEVLILRFIEDMSVAETAIILDKKEVTVRALQFKGLSNLRKRLEGIAEAERDRPETDSTKSRGDTGNTE